MAGLKNDEKLTCSDDSTFSFFLFLLAPAPKDNWFTVHLQSACLDSEARCPPALFCPRILLHVEQ